MTKKIIVKDVDRDEYRESTENDAVGDREIDRKLTEMDKLDYFNTEQYEMRIYRLGANDSKEFLWIIQGSDGWTQETIPKLFGGGRYYVQWNDVTRPRKPFVNKDILFYSFDVYGNAKYKNADNEKYKNNPEMILYNSLSEQVKAIAESQKGLSEAIKYIFEHIKGGNHNVSQEKPKENPVQMGNINNDNVIIQFLKQQNEDNKQFYKDLLEQEREEKRELRRKVEKLESSPVMTVSNKSNPIDDFAKIMGVTQQVVSMSGLNNNNQIE